MKTTRLETVSQEREGIDSVTCNMCGEKIPDNTPGHADNYATLMYTGGYASKLGDMTSFEFDLCEGCLLRIMRSCKIRPAVSCDCFTKAIGEQCSCENAVFGAKS